MEGEKGSYAGPVVVTPPAYQSHEEPKKTWNRSHVAWAIAAVAIVLIVVAGFSLGGYFFSKTTTDMAKQYHLQFKEKDGNSVDETISNDVEENTQLFHLHTTDGEQWILKDWTRDIEVYKSHEMGRSMCFVSPLNRSQEITPKELDTDMTNNPPTAEDLEKPKSGAEAYYTVASEPIADPSYLGPKVTELCEGSEVYWIYPSCPEEKDGDEEEKTNPGAVGRGKRSTPAFTCRYGCCYKVCCCMSAYYRYYSGGYVNCRWLCSKSCNTYYSRSNSYCY